MSQMPVKQKKSLLKIVDQLHRSDLIHICGNHSLLKSGNKDVLKKRITDLIDNSTTDWSKLKKEIKKVFNANEKIKKKPKSDKKLKTIVEGVDAVASTEANGQQKVILNVPKVLVKDNTSHESVNQNHYDFLTYFNVQRFQSNSSVDNSSQRPPMHPLLSYQPPLANRQPFPLPSHPNPSVNSFPMNPIEQHFGNVNNYQQMVGNRGDPDPYHPVPNNPIQQSNANPNTGLGFSQPIDCSLNNNNNNQNIYQNFFHQNYIPNQIPDVFNPQNFDSLIKEQEFLLSQFPQSFQEKDSSSDSPLSNDFWFKFLPKFKLIKTLVKTQTIGSLSDIGFEVDVNLNPIDLGPVCNEDNIECLQDLLERKSYKIQLRFGYISNIQTKEQKDCVPEYLCIDVNNHRFFTYSENESNGPFEMNEFCHYGPNKVKFFLSKEKYTFLMPCLYEISIVSFETPETFLSRLKQNCFQYLSSQTTKHLILSRNDGQLSSDEVVITIINSAIKVKLICPLSCRRIETPCRTDQCKHIECFDGLAFFKTNEFRYEWVCPICQKSAQFESLRIDGYFKEILDSTEDDFNELSIKCDGTYDLTNSNTSPDVIELDDNSDEELGFTTSAIVDADGYIVID